MINENFNHQKRLVLIFLVALFLLSFLYRLYGLSKNNPPFWVDEFSSANQGKIFLKYGLSAFTNPHIYIEHYNITTHLLIALSYKLFGVNEFAARFPMVIIGSLVPVIVFVLARYLTNVPTAVSASLLAAFSYFEITWSRQARGYIIVQFLILMSFFLYLKLIEINKPNLILSFAFLLTIFLGTITHPLYYIFLICIFFHFLFMSHKRLIDLLKKPWFYLIIFTLIFTVYKIGFITAFIRILTSKTFLTNNFWYYHPFLWREYGLITFLAILGFLFIIFKKGKVFLPILIYLVLHLIFITSIFKPYVSRYVLPIFPFLLIGASYTIWQLLQNLPSRNDRIKMVVLILLTLFIIANGHKFVNKPKKYYSLNHDFREIANINYHQIYEVIKNKGELEKGQTVVIDTWWDRAGWYLNEDFKNVIAFRWFNEEGYVNGLPKKTTFIINEKGEKILKGTALRLVLEVKDLKKYMNQYQIGFLFIDDSSLPQDIKQFAEKNLKKELYLDHYASDDNPYSIWPATLYSWGIN
ncbi:glycosyltransferase family 39 protein [Candidatus Roizmanbacteria bacterium]|nr:glycosyltransferase family 39 protein [Candidatus Roizmanbacteria bacterium]